MSDRDEMEWESDGTVFEPCGSKGYSRIKPEARAELRLYAQYLTLKKTEKLPPFDEWRVGKEAPPGDPPFARGPMHDKLTHALRWWFLNLAEQNRPAAAYIPTVDELADLAAYLRYSGFVREPQRPMPETLADINCAGRDLT